MGQAEVCGRTQTFNTQREKACRRASPENSHQLERAELVLRHGLAARLVHERRLGELLNGNVTPGKRRRDIVIGDDNKNLPQGITRNLSIYAQTLAKCQRQIQNLPPPSDTTSSQLNYKKSIPIKFVTVRLDEQEGYRTGIS